MKRLLTLAPVALLLLTLVGCAGMGGEKKTQVTCPACGYGFEAPIK